MFALQAAARFLPLLPPVTYSSAQTLSAESFFANVSLHVRRNIHTVPTSEDEGTWKGNLLTGLPLDKEQ